MQQSKGIQNKTVFGRWTLRITFTISSFIAYLPVICGVIGSMILGTQAFEVDKLLNKGIICFQNRSPIKVLLYINTN